MQVNIYGTLRLITGQKTLQVVLPGSPTLRDLLEQIIRMVPALETELMESGGTLRQDQPIFVNGRNPRLHSDFLDQPLQPEDVISLFGPISSGRLNVEDLRQHASGQKE